MTAGKVTTPPMCLPCATTGHVLMFFEIVGSSQYLTAPTPARPFAFDLHLDTPAYNDEDTFARIQDSDARLMEMVAAQAHHREDGSPGEDEDAIAMDDELSDEEKREILQKRLNMAASNGDVARIRKLVGGRAKAYVDVNQPDEEGTVPLIYASCFVWKPIYAPAGTVKLTVSGTPRRRGGFVGRGSDRGQARSESVERSHVGHDESSQDHRKAASRPWSQSGRPVVIRRHRSGFRATRLGLFRLPPRKWLPFWSHESGGRLLPFRILTGEIRRRNGGK